MKAFAKIGRSVHERWKRENFSDNSFASIAATALAECNATQQLSFEDIVDHALIDDYLEPQTCCEPGEPSLVLFQTEAFYIEVLASLDGTTALQQHDFAGAFQVLEGSSLHSTYDFVEQRQCGDHLKFGSLTLGSAEVLRKGDIRTVGAGPHSIQSAFHLERPTVPILVRTRAPVAVDRRFTFGRTTGLGWDPAHHPRVLAKRLQLLRTLGNACHPRTSEWLVAMLNGSDLFATFRLALQFGLQFPDMSGALRHYAGNLGADHQEVVNMALERAHEQGREEALRQLIQKVHVREHRLLLGLVLNVGRLDRILEIVQHEFSSDDPAALVARWATELTQGEYADCSPLGASLGVAGIELIQRMLDGHPDQAGENALEQPHGAEASGPHPLRPRPRTQGAATSTPPTRRM